MNDSELLVGARSREAVEQALREALPGLGMAVVDATDVANLSERYERGGDEPSISIAAVDDGIHTVAVRGARGSQWTNELGRRLSLRLGGWAATCVNDRPHHDHGYGFYLDGLPIEAAVRSGGLLVERTGFLPQVPDRALLDRLAEDTNQRTFHTALEQLAGPYVTPWPPTGSIRVLFIEGDGITTEEAVRPSSTLVLAASHRERIDLAGFEYEIEGATPGEGVRVLAARTALPDWEVHDRLDAAGGVAFFTNGERAWVRRGDEQDCEEVAWGGLRAALDAWEPVCSATRTAPMAFTFDAVRSASPWR